MKTWSEEVAEQEERTRNRNRAGQGGNKSNSMGGFVITDPTVNNPVIGPTPNTGITITPKAIGIILVLAGIGYYVWKSQKGSTS